MAINRRLLLRSRPAGLPADSDFDLVEAVVPAIGEGEYLIRNRYASIDPAMRGWLDDRPSYLPPVAIGAAMRAGTLGEVVASYADGVPVGAWVKGINALEDFSVGRGDDGNRLIDPTKVSSITHYISVAGGAALTAYVGVHCILQPKPGETLLVSSAAGGVGAVAGQLARLGGATVVGIAGGAEKCRRLTEVLGFDHAIDHRGKDEADFLHALREAVPDGLDLVFENVGGAGFDAALLHLKPRARIALCGLLSEYNTPPVGARNLREIIFRSATMRGFTLLDFPDQIAPATDHLLQLAASGEVCFAEHIEHGLANAPAAMRRLFEGGLEGKLILEL